MNKKLVIMLFCIIFFAGCASVMLSRPEEYVQNNPQLSEVLKDQILRNQISIGMTKEMVHASWGDPYFTEKVRTATQSIENWVYTRDLARNYCCALPEVVHFKDGRVSGWTQRMKY